MTNHTPGPWTYRLQVSDFIIETQLYGEDIAVIHSNLGGTAGDNANASLIAVTPELLRLAENIASCGKGDGPINKEWVFAAIDQARAIVAKIAGKGNTK